MRKLLLFVLLPAFLIGAAVWASFDSDEGPTYRTVAVTRGTIVREALATGRIEPRFEVPVNSRNGGVLTACFVQLGQKVAAGDPLVEIRPVLTEQDILSAERALLAAREAEANVEEFREGENVMGRAMLWLQGDQNVERMRRNAERARNDAEERLRLLREGSTEIDGRQIDFVVRAPIAGHVIHLDGEVGQPVVPSSSYGSGTVLLILADMDDPVFRGRVNESDVGRLREGMQASISIGALPGTRVDGTLREIALRSRSVNNATVFDIELDVTPPEGLVLRSGYSAVAHVEIARAEDVPVLPERVVEYRGDEAFVLIGDGPDASGERREVPIETGLSNGLLVEVTGELEVGAEVLERVY